MKKFKIIFQTFIYDKNDQVKVVGTWTRIIAAENRDWAEKFAKAMEHEEVAGDLYLGNVVLIEETGEDPAMNSLDSEGTWSQVIDNLKMSENDFDPIADPNDPDEVIGLKKK